MCGWPYNRSILVFAVFFLACSILVLRQATAQPRGRLDRREAFIRLYPVGDPPQAGRLDRTRLPAAARRSDAPLLDDFQRAPALVNPTRPPPENLR